MLTEAASVNTDRLNPIAFQLKSLKTFGAIQMVLGGILATIGAVGLILDKSKKDCSFSLDIHSYLRFDFLKCEDRSNDLIGMDGACLGLSIWVMVTGAIPMFMTQKRETEWRSLRLAFMVCSIIGASAIVPTIGALGLAGLIFRRALLPWAVETWATSVAIMITAFLTFVLTIVSCSYSLCCAPKPENEQRTTIINVANVVPSKVPGYQFPMGYQPNPYLQGQMPMQFTGAGQVPGNAPAASGYPLCPTSPYGMVQQSLSGGSPQTVNDKNIEID
ncbi:uncharacterized protein LOC127702796 [Mytilus californianus]|uniref:uncharacterized protein LOC127702796 n=1 Tax=Mytilus californianus TaxID=6549 RepID=UPI0022476FA2|nr:uncharacterized protein LOC127702796 [Mytilus californianus]